MSVVALVIAPTLAVLHGTADEAATEESNVTPKEINVEDPAEAAVSLADENTPVLGADQE